MQVTDKTNNPYNDILAYQRQNISSDSPFVKPLSPKPQNPIFPENPTTPQHPIFPDLNLTPEEKLNIQHAIEDAMKRQEEEKARKERKARELMAQYTKEQSIKTQIEIYLSVATDGDIDMNDNDLNALKSLRDIKKQNDIMAGYSTYKELQNKKGDFFTT